MVYLGQNSIFLCFIGIHQAKVIVFQFTRFPVTLSIHKLIKIKVVSLSITSEYGGTVFLSLLVILFDIIWIFIWGSCFSVYMLVTDEPNGFVLFLLFVSFYWAFFVNQNISHTTTCGVTAAWYFSTELNYNPTPRLKGP